MTQLSRHTTLGMWAAATACALLTAGCTSTNTVVADASSLPPTPSTLSGDITVFAAASLTATFTQMADEFERQHPDVHVTFSFAGSSDLATQIVEGAPADVFASANEAQMQVVHDASMTASAPVPFATNVLTIVVPADNPAAVTSFADLGNAEVSTVVCAPQVPCGAATVTLEENSGVDIPAVSEESSVTDVLGKVSSGQADAGIVYVTDIARGADGVVAVPIQNADAAINLYPIAALASATSPDAAAAFVDFVTSTDGMALLTEAGFGTP